MGAPTAGAAGNGYDRQYLHDAQGLRSNLPRQERVVRYEYVNHGHIDEGRVQRTYGHGEIYRTQDPSTDRAAPRAPGAPPVPRPSRQDGVIYIE
ncbi:hypothetical protein NKR19_g750 [Coniochaeta hoffmannii]|uniref:Uncharacterized protein n=1 Tax=Coniochaeta hoffmannii TaxID=91930 RepID=A0AA38RZM6_9PEZI|nr:hypothetical protein NKR19_g750 [Coniochaeta hoffmannii]